MIFPEWMECAGERFGIILNIVYARGLEFGIAGITIINGRAALSTIDDKPLAPFLSSALSQLSAEPYVWATALIGIGLIHFAVLGCTFNSEKIRARAVMVSIQALTYTAISTAILTGHQPSMAAERYMWNGTLAFLCSVVLASRILSPAPQLKGGPLSG